MLNHLNYKKNVLTNLPRLCILTRLEAKLGEWSWTKQF